MSAAHTPAPWAIKFRNDSSAYISMGSPDGEHKQFDIEFDARYPSDVADARLIAAAPELLAALQTALRNAREAMPASERAAFDGTRLDNTSRRGPTWMFDVERAIAVATKGEE